MSDIGEGFTKEEIDVIESMFNGGSENEDEMIGDEFEGGGSDHNCKFIPSVSEGGEELFLNKKEALNFLLNLLQ
jgi:hypothetical protein